MQPITVTIIAVDTVTAVGLKHFLHNLFNIDAAIMPADASRLQDTAANSDLYIASPEAFASCPGFFIPRRSRLLLLSDRDDCDDHTGYTINRFCSESQFIGRMTKIMEHVRDTRIAGNELSQREIEVLCLVAKGMTNKEIADRLCISINTVLSHRKNITAKLGIRSVSGLSVYAMMNGYISDIPSKD